MATSGLMNRIFYVTLLDLGRGDPSAFFCVVVQPFRLDITILFIKRPQSRRQYIYIKPIKPRTMEVLTIEHSAFQQLISKIDAMDEFIRKAKLEQQSSLDNDWVDGQAVCEYLCICDKTLQRLRSAGKITYSTIGTSIITRLPRLRATRS